MSSRAVVVLAAGKGTRMNSKVPKVLHKVCGVPMVELVVRAAKLSGLGPVIVVVPSSGSGIKATLGEEVEYVQQCRQLGTGDALLQTQVVLEKIDNVILTYADVPLIRHETITSLFDQHISTGAVVSLLTTVLDQPGDLGRVVRDREGKVSQIVEERFADEYVKAITEVNTGTYCFKTEWLWDNLKSLDSVLGGEVLLTDLVKMAHEQEFVIETQSVKDPNEAIGINTRVNLATAETVLQDRIRRRWMLAGVTMIDPGSVYIDAQVQQIGCDTVLLPNTHVSGDSIIGERCQIGPNSVIDRSVLGEDCQISSSIVRDSTFEARVQVGPFAHVRSGSYLEQDVRIGSHAEVKASRLGRGTKSGHFSYLGDAEIGSNVNIGAGSVTANFDGSDHYQTHIGNEVSIGSGSMLVAPVMVGPKSSTGAGSVVTKDVPANSIAKGVPARSEPNDPSTDKEGG